MTRSNGRADAGGPNRGELFFVLIAGLDLLLLLHGLLLGNNGLLLGNNRFLIRSRIRRPQCYLALLQALRPLQILGSEGAQGAGCLRIKDRFSQPHAALSLLSQSYRLMHSSSAPWPQ
jgi:hypothetical protein